MNDYVLQDTFSALPVIELDERDLFDQMLRADQDDMALLKLVGCIAVATILIALAVSLT
jgi:hypothetical protein